jgi:hypothetical protein
MSLGTEVNPADKLPRGKEDHSGGEGSLGPVLLPRCPAAITTIQVTA